MTGVKTSGRGICIPAQTGRWQPSPDSMERCWHIWRCLVCFNTASLSFTWSAAQRTHDQGWESRRIKSCWSSWSLVRPIPCDDSQTITRQSAGPVYIQVWPISSWRLRNTVSESIQYTYFKVYWYNLQAEFFYLSGKAEAPEARCLIRSRGSSRPVLLHWHHPSNSNTSR